MFDVFYDIFVSSAKELSKFLGRQHGLYDLAKFVDRCQYALRHLEVYDILVLFLHEVIDW